MHPTILLVDDDHAVVRSLCMMLNEVAPWEILVAYSAAEALEMLAKTAVDVIVSDERMPDMSGCELLARVRREHPDIARILLTGDGSLATAIQAINQAEIYRFLTKPCHTEELRATIESALQVRGDRRQTNRRAGDAKVEPSTVDLTVHLEQALASMWMAFQPIVSIAAGSAVGYEALLRSHHPVLTDPMLLLGAAERLGRIPEVDLRILGAVLRQVPSAPPDALLFVNLHPHTLDEPTLYTQENPLAPVATRVVLEITERSSIEEIPDLLEKIAALRALGFRIALDDLGAGYSGLSSLARVKPEFVKYDKELIQSLASSSTHRKLVRSLESLCCELGLRTIAEGVETSEQRDALLTLGCDYQQGYFFGRPVKDFAAIDLRA